MSGKHMWAGIGVVVIVLLFLAWLLVFGRHMRDPGPIIGAVAGLLGAIAAVIGAIYGIGGRAKSSDTQQSTATESTSSQPRRPRVDDHEGYLRDDRRSIPGRYEAREPRYTRGQEVEFARPDPKDKRFYIVDVRIYESYDAERDEYLFSDDVIKTFRERR
jgi:hypothetical protein